MGCANPTCEKSGPPWIMIDVAEATGRVGVVAYCRRSYATQAGVVWLWLPVEERAKGRNPRKFGKVARIGVDGNVKGAGNGDKAGDVE